MSRRLTDWTKKELRKEVVSLRDRLDALELAFRGYDGFRTWAQEYLDGGRWAGHHYGDAIKTELLERDAECTELKQERARLDTTLAGLQRSFLSCGADRIPAAWALNWLRDAIKYARDPAYRHLFNQDGLKTAELTESVPFAERNQSGSGIEGEHGPGV